MKTIIIILLSILTISCASSNPNVPHPTPIVQDTDKCPDAQANLQKLQCISSTEPYTKRDKLTFTQYCQYLQNEGVFINPNCLATITNCDQQNECTGTTKASQ